MICITVALHCEARPIIDHYKLKPVSSTPYKVYSNNEIVLVISGIGKLAAASATNYLCTMTTINHITSCLNIGIAGHASQDIGKPILIHKCIDNDGRHAWYPIICFRPPCETGNLITVNQPEEHYRDDFYYDMEAAGFFHAAHQFVSAEQAHCLKVVSDNRMQHWHKLNKNDVSALIADKLDCIKLIIDGLQQ